MEEEEKTDRNVKVFNTAKLFVEEILFKFMKDYFMFQRQAEFGDEDLRKAIELSEEIREIQRFNGLKGMAVTTNNFIQAVLPTVISKGNKQELIKLNELLKITKDTITFIYSNKEKFFDTSYSNGLAIESLNRICFQQIKDIIESCYNNNGVIMNRNKLLFDSSADEFLTDDEIKDAIKKEYIEN